VLHRSEPFATHCMLDKYWLKFFASHSSTSQETQAYLPNDFLNRAGHGRLRSACDVSRRRLEKLLGNLVRSSPF